MLLAEIPSEPWILLAMGIVLLAALLAIGCELISIVFGEVDDGDDVNEEK